MRFFLLALMATLLSAQAQADTLGVIINGTAIHLDDGDWNEQNWGTGIQYEFDTSSAWTPYLSLSGFIDSNHHNSYYAGGGYKRRIKSLSSRDGGGRTEVGAIAFLMTRKDYLDNSPFFGALPVLTVGSGKLDINVTYIPAVDPKLVELFFIQAVYKFELG